MHDSRRPGRRAGTVPISAPCGAGCDVTAGWCKASDTARRWNQGADLRRCDVRGRCQRSMVHINQSTLTIPAGHPTRTAILHDNHGCRLRSGSYPTRDEASPWLTTKVAGVGRNVTIVPAGRPGCAARPPRQALSGPVPQVGNVRGAGHNEGQRHGALALAGAAGTSCQPWPGGNRRSSRNR